VVGETGAGAGGGAVAAVAGGADAGADVEDGDGDDDDWGACVLGEAAGPGCLLDSVVVMGVVVAQVVAVPDEVGWC
jgi:hypothetical protein